MERRRVALLAGAHLLNDVHQSAVLGLLPILVAERGLGFGTASILVAAPQLGSALVQPILGHRADRAASAAAIPLALLVGAVGVAAVGLVGTAGAVAAVVVVGLATAGFHPESTRALRSAAGTAQASALSLYALGGNLGTALGPLAAATLIGALGWRGLWVLVGVALLACLFVADPTRGRVASRTVRSPGAPSWGRFSGFVAVLALRAAYSSSVSTFGPLLLVGDGFPPERAGLVLTLVLLGSVAGGVLAGPLADRLGARTVLVAVLAPVGPLLGLLTVVHGNAAIFCLVVLGLFNMAPYAIAVAGAQACLPGREGLAAGIAMGVGSALGATLLPLVGRLADVAGLRAALLAAAVLPAAAALLGYHVGDGAARARHGAAQGR